MNHKDNRRVKLTKQLLKDSLCELLEQADIHEISVRTLCENADINRSTFYKYYDSIYDLLKEMENDFLKEIEKSLSVDNTETTDRLAHILCYIQSNSKMCKLLLSSNIDSDFPKRLMQLPSIIQNMNDIISVTDDSLGISYLHDFILYGGYQMIKRWVNEDCRIPSEEMVSIIDKVFRKLSFISL